MGVNLPAHLVIIKSTMYYNMGSHEEYPDTQVLQMIGRAGRPQFDTSATAVIMTKNSTKVSIISFFWWGYTYHQQSKSDMATFQLYWWRKTLGAPGLGFI